MTAARTNRSGTISLGKLAVSTSTLALLAIAFVPSAARAQDATFSGTQTTSGPYTYGQLTFVDDSAMNANAADALTLASLAYFHDNSTLNVTAVNAIHGGHQTFYDNAKLNADVANGIGGGLQYFYGHSVLDAYVTDAVSSGDQHFYEDSVLNARAIGSISQHSLYFNDRSVLNASAGAIGSGTQFFAGNSVLKALGVGAVGSGAQSFTDSSQLQATVTDAVTAAQQDFSGQATLDITAAGAVSGGRQRFYNSAGLLAAATHAVGGASQQEFYDSSFLIASVANAVSDGTQSFHNDSRLDATATNAMSGGQQTFNERAHLNASAAGAVSGGQRIFYTSSMLNASVAGAVTGGAQMFTDSSKLNIGADNALTNAVRVHFGYSGYPGAPVPGPGGTLSLNGFNTVVGGLDDSNDLFGTLNYLYAGAGVVENGGTANSILTVDSSVVGDSEFSGLIRDGDGTSGTLSLVKTGAGKLTLGGDNSYTGTTTVSAGDLQLNGWLRGAVTVKTGGTLSTGATVVNGTTLGNGGGVHNSVTVEAGGTLAGASALTFYMDSLTLNSGSRINVALGAPSASGLFNVTGNLTLAGTLNVTNTGGFGSGLYRLFDYGGTLTDNGMTVGATPTGYAAGDLTVQKTTGQVNLLVGSVAPGGYAFWDGPNTAADNIVNGGTGTWSASGINWTNAGGSANGAYDPASMLIFQGTPGTVTVDAGGGALAVNGGMQFFVNGYNITGGSLNLTASAVPIRVGDGTSAGSGMTATVASTLTGSGGIDKTDRGTLVLTGASTYWGGTTISAGTLKVTGDATLGAVTNGLTIANGATLGFDTAALKVGSLSGAGTITRSDFNPGVLTVDQATSTNFSGAINDYFDEINGVTTMTGLTKAGTGTLTLSGNSTYTGATNVTGGTLLVDGALGHVMWGPIQLGTTQVAVASGASLGGAGSIAGDVSVADGGILLGRAGQTLSMGSLALSGGSVVDVSLGGPSTARLFNVAGNLTLDGTLNVSNAGAFGNGLYRLFDYGGTLTDNGLTVGATPTGYAAGDLTVQTSVANQVNLLVGAVAPGSYSFWNGAQTTPNNAVNGGTGTWSAAGTNWTNAGGSASGVYDPAALLIFAGAPGMVTVSAGGGALDVNGGMQFFVGGYQLSGDALNLTAADTPIRVGDGTAGGAGMTATISSALTGSGGVTKTDLGTLALTGTSNFTGEITVNGGAVAIRNGGNVTNAAGEIAKDAGTTGTVTVDGAGSVWKNGSGVLVGIGANSNGTLNIINGGKILQTGGDGIVGYGATGTATVDGVGSTWNNSSVTSATKVGWGGGNGTLSITNGGSVSDTFGEIGDSGTGTVTVDGAGSTWTNSSNLNVGAYGSGTLNITNGGSVSSATAIVGNGSGADGTVTIDSAGSWTNNGVLKLGQGGSGTLNLNGAVGARGVLATPSISKGQGTGAVNFDGGILRATIVDGDLLGGFAAGDVTIKAGGAFIDTNGVNVSISSPLGGVGALTKQGAGELYVTGANTYQGGTNIAAGRLFIGDGGTLGATTGSLVIAGGATLDLGITSQTVGSLSGAGTVTSTVLMGNTSRLTVNQSANTSFTGSINNGFDPIAGGATTIALTKAGTGKLTLGGVSNYSGATTVDGGELRIDGSIASATTVNTGGTLSGGGSITNNVVIANGGTLSGAAGSTLTMNSLTLNSGSNVTVALGAPSTAGLFDVTGNLTLDGTLNVNNAGGFGDGLYRLFDAGSVTDNGLAIGTTPAGYAAGNLSVQTTTNQVNLLVATSTSPGSFAFWNGAHTTPNNLVNGGAGSWSATGTNWTNAAGSASGAYDPAAMLIFQGTPGTVTVSAGGGALDVNGGMQFFVNGYKVVGDALNLTAAATPIRVGDGTTAGAGMTATVSSVITGSGGLDKTDLGTLVLSGFNTYAGDTTISAGTLKFDVDLGGMLGAPTGALAIAGGASFDLTGTSQTVGTLSGAGSITSSVYGGRQSPLTVNQATNTNFSGAITDGFGTGAGDGAVWLIKDGAGTLTLSGNSAFSFTTVDGGTLAIANGGTVANETSNLGNAAGSNGTVLVTGSGSVWSTNYLYLGYAGAGTLTVADGGRVSIDTVDMAHANSGSGTLNLNGTAGARGVLETGFAGGNRGEVTVNFDGGILRATDADTLLTGGVPGSVTVKAGGAFIDSNGYHMEIASPLGGVGALTKLGAGTLTLTGNNSYAGGTIIDTGTLQLAGTGTLGAPTGALTVAAGAALDLGSTSQTVGSLSGAGNVTSTVTMGSPSVLTVDQASDTIFSGAITNGVQVLSPGSAGLPAIIVPTVVGLTKSGSGTLSLSGSNSYTGDTNVTGGTLLVDGALGNTRVAVGSGAALGGAGAIAGGVSVASGGILLGRAGQTLSMGSLALNAGAVVEVTLGAPSATRLFDVAGDLTLNGTLNVGNAGGFGDGLYRLFDYGGALSGAGLTIGATPASYAAGDLTVQTSVAHQVNLIASSGPYIFWDGANTIGNGRVDGGSGVWSAAGTNWANTNATSNGAYDPATMLIFVGTPGTVTVDAGGAGALDIATGVQFADDGFIVQGDGLALTGASTVIRVGNGIASGANVTATIASALTGSGHLDKTDLGTLILTGANSYAGGTTIAAGTLQLGNGGTTGSILGDVANNGRLVFDRSNALTFAGAISGSGALEQIGTGTTTLTAANTYTGGTTISGGTLAIAATGGITSDVTNSATFQNAGTVAGRVTNNAGATFVQSGGSVSNGLVNAGTVNANGGALNGAIANNAGGSFTVGGTVTGNGAFSNANGASLAVAATGGFAIAGLLTNSGAVSVAAGGSLTAPAGILNKAGGVITNNGTITDALDNAGTVTNNGVYNADVASNTGTITNSAGATWNGNFNTAGIVNNGGTINGSLTQSGGTTTNIGAITGTVTIAGGLFTGAGSVGGLNLAGGATIAPGAGGGIGTMSVAGAVTFGAGSIYQVAVNAAGQASRINATGLAVINGGTVDVLAGAGNYRPQTDYTILSAAGGVSGTFATVTSNLAFLDPSLRYDAGNVYLRLRRNDISFAGIGQTPNQIAVGGPTERLGWDNQVFDAAVNLSAAQARNAFDQLSGDIHPAMRTAMLEDSRFVRGAVWDRLRDSAGEGGRGVWGQAIGSWGHSGSDGNAARLDRSTGGLLMGLDAGSETVRLGAVWGYSRTNIDVDARGSSGKIDSYHLGAYAGGQWGAAAIRAGVAYSWSDLHTTRNIAFPGFSDTTRASYNGGTFQAFGELGYGFDLGRTRLEPYANAAYVRARTSGFGESGGDARLSGARAATDVTFTTIGLRTATSFDLGGAQATLRAGAGWRHAFGDAAPVTALRYRAGGSAFTIAGLPAARDAATIDAGLDIAISGRTSIGLSYGGQFGNRLSDQTARVNLAFRF
ncbi:MAG TPA: autotransporter-associated beta strand repeat-containing protein [Sphingomonas sp.]